MFRLLFWGSLIIAIGWYVLDNARALAENLYYIGGGLLVMAGVMVWREARHFPKVPGGEQGMVGSGQAGGGAAGGAAQQVPVTGGVKPSYTPPPLETKDIDAKRLAALINEDIIGQSRAVEAVAAQVSVSLAKKERDKPVSVIVAVGGPGVGKTMLGERLAHHLGRPCEVVDMTKYKTRHDSWTLFGAAAGHMGSESPGKIPGILLRNPNAVVILDNVQAAEVLEDFVSVLSAGAAEQRGSGVRIDARNAIFVITTTAGAVDIDAAAQRLADEDEFRLQASAALKGEGFPERLIDAVDVIAPFATLSMPHLGPIAASAIARAAQAYGLELVGNDTAIDPYLVIYIVRRAIKAGGGAREVLRQVDKYLGAPLKEAQNTVPAPVRITLSEGAPKVVAAVTEQSFAARSA